MDTRRRLTALARERILILDGAMGTLLQAALKNEAAPASPGCNDEFCLTRPALVRSVHEAYLEAGADIIETCSFNANAVSLADYGLEKEAYRISRAAAAVAREAADAFSSPAKPRFVAGSLGPTTKSASVAADMDNPGKRSVGFDELAAAYRDNARGLLDGGADLLLVETVYDTLNAKAALFAIGQLLEERGGDTPVMVSATLSGPSGRLLAGQTLEAFCVSVLHAAPWSLGLNCSLGAELMAPHLRELAALAPVFVSCHPNAGLPNREGGYDETPEMMANTMETFMAEGLLNIAGGCCGTTPAHIAALAERAAKHKPRVFGGHFPQAAGRGPRTYLAGLEALPVPRRRRDKGFTVIGERTNVAGSRRFLRLIREEDYDGALAVAREMLAGGADILDVCMDDALLDGEKALTSFLNLALAVPEIARAPVMLDSSRWETIEAGLKCLQGKALVNSLSLKEGEAEFLRRAYLARAYGAAVVVMLFDEKGQADSFKRKIEVARRSYRLLTEDGFPPEDIVFDPNVLAVATGLPGHDRLAFDFLRACSWLRRRFPLAQVSGGVSNLSFSFRGSAPAREALHAAFLRRAVKAGLSLAIVNPSELARHESAADGELGRAALGLILAQRGAAEKLLALVSRTGAGQAAASPSPARDEERAASPEERVFRALVSGSDEHIERDVLELVPRYPGIFEIVEGHLMRGMREVGERFGKGEIFLPQVIRSARVMKKAVAALESGAGFPETGGDGAAKKPAIVLATVKGDVHDIGKNIVSVVLGCGGFRIIDLGVMAGRDAILDAARDEGACAVGLSGLITPSLDEMIAVARGMEERGMTIPLLIGGAAASLAHTALRIAPEYRGPVVYVRDASRAPDTARRLLSPSEAPRFLDELSRLYREAAGRSGQAGRGRVLLTLEEARANRERLSWGDEVSAPAEAGRGIVQFDNYPVANVLPRVNWEAFYSAWDFSAGARAVGAAEKAALHRDAEAVIARAVRDNALTLKAVYRFFPALSRGETVILFADETCRAETARFHFPRNQAKQPDDGKNLCLSDFVMPEELSAGAGSGKSVMGLFALSAGFGVEEEAARLRQSGDEYGALLLATAANSLAEAFSGELHRLACGGSGIRPAFGYPVCPNHQDKALALTLLEARERLGFRLTESAMLIPAASVCGMYFPHPAARYFPAGPAGPAGRVQYSDAGSG
ncbi:MAG: methionine synthase [Treponematales bacterium]